MYPFIEAEKAGQRSVNRACAVLKVSRAAYYRGNRSGRPPPGRPAAHCRAASWWWP